MKFTTLSHAAMYVEHNGVSVVTDPWLIGSCYWRSWWNFPEPTETALTSFTADYVYLTHLHWDHYHGPSLRKFFTKNTTFLVPKICPTRMVDDLRSMGFSRIVEIPHNKEYRLEKDFTIVSYQFGTGVDSVAIFKGGGTRIFDVNDCKIFGRPLRHLLRCHGRPDFVLRSHSSASPIPYCVEGYRKDFGSLRTKEDYIEEFARFAISVGARYAVPFASNHCFLHKDTLHFNSTAVSPRQVEIYCNQLAREVSARTRCIVMNPGSSWSDQKGFEVVEFDFDRREEHISTLGRKHARKLQMFYAEEDQELADFEAFREYFEAFLSSVPWLIRTRWKPALMFRVRDAERTHRWLVEPATRTVREVEADVADAVVLVVPPRVINDCCTLKMFSVWTPSKRLKIRLPTPSALGSIKLLFNLIDAYELENLPLRRNLRLRSMEVFARRWREGIEAARLVLKHKVFRQPFEIRNLYPLPGVAPDQELSGPKSVRPSNNVVIEPATGVLSVADVPESIGFDPGWVTVVRVFDVAPGSGKQVRVGDHVLAIFNVAGKFHAIADRCTHRNGKLSQGIFEGTVVTCPLHGARFDVRTGEALCAPAKRPVACFPVRIAGDEVQVELPSGAPQGNAEAVRESGRV